MSIPPGCFAQRLGKKELPAGNAQDTTNVLLDWTGVPKTFCSEDIEFTINPNCTERKIQVLQESLKELEV